MRLPSLPFRIQLRPIHPSASISLPQSRHKSETSTRTIPAKGGWTKNAGKKKPTSAPTSNNPFLQGMNFDKSDSRVKLYRYMLFSQKPIRGLGLNPQDQIRHETIHRAWMLFQAQRRKQKILRLKALEDSIAKTMKVLRETDENLYAMAVQGAREEEKRFPLVIRIPTDTLSRPSWNYKWTPANIKGIGGVAKPG